MPPAFLDCCSPRPWRIAILLVIPVCQSAPLGAPAALQTNKRPDRLVNLLLVYAALRHKDPRTLRLGRQRLGAGKRVVLFLVRLTRFGPLKSRGRERGRDFCRASPPTGREGAGMGECCRCCCARRGNQKKAAFFFLFFFSTGRGGGPCSLHVAPRELSRGGEGLPSPSCSRAWRRQGWGDRRGEGLLGARRCG
ncbi:hypothetical protein LX32DRAFT_78900 [Colletotrichum zoysiae]|uniref:Secreted protein n=1 Tax=Colletotrichum zoysiae TaxID=1216348 RepID=A0AAD9LWL6_9PEZI|nr:hypothetical protein LX32DRAFT_78900 [Colletotrichum zoysiae]